MHVFKKIEKARAELNANLETYKTDESKLKLEKEKLDALQIIIDYMEGMTWLRRKNAIDKYKALKLFNFKTEKVADYLGTTNGSVKSSLTYISNQLEDKIGKNTIDLIMEGNITTAMLQFRTGTGCVEITKLIDKDIYNSIDLGDYKGRTVEDCELELKFLKALTFESIRYRLSKLNKDNFALIDRIMNSNDMIYAKERVLIFKYLSNEITSIDDLLAHLRHIDEINI